MDPKANISVTELNYEALVSHSTEYTRGPGGFLDTIARNEEKAVGNGEEQSGANPIDQRVSRHK